MITHSPVAESVPFDNKNIFADEVQTAVEIALPFHKVTVGQKRFITKNNQMIVYQTMFVDGNSELSVDGELVVL